MEVLIKLNPAEAKTAISSGTMLLLIEAVHAEEQNGEKIIKTANEEVKTTPASVPVQQPISQQDPVQQAQPMQQNQSQLQVPTQPTQVPTSAPTYTMEQLAVAATQIVDAGRRAELVSLLGSFGVQALTALPKEQYGAFATQLRGMGSKI